MNRRSFLTLPAAALAAPSTYSIEDFYRRIQDGYARWAQKTSSSLAVVEFPGATVTKNFLAKSGLSVTGTTRMLPALAAWAVSGRDRDNAAFQAALSALRNGTNPHNPDYWLHSPEKQQNQRQVESSIVAWSVWLLRDRLLPALTPDERRNVAAWLASCTRVPVRSNNWAWFTAVNQAVRLSLAPRWPEFRGDEAWMLEDLKLLDSLAVGDSGWYNDTRDGAAFDYYNSWVFASHFLYWNEIVGAKYPQWRDRFSARLKKYLQSSPHFFGAHGGHILYGRSLIYRFAVLTPFILAYQQKLWPHSPGLLKRIVRGNFEFHDRLGALDPDSGKLRESYTPEGSPSIKESYIDGGHPYWGMQAFALWRIPQSDPFWTAAEEPLPVEQNDFTLALPGPGLLLAGSRRTGAVRLYNALSTLPDPHYRDKYNKFVYSSHQGFCCVQEAGRIPWDSTLVLTDGKTTAGRSEFLEHKIAKDRIDLRYEIHLGPVTAQVKTAIHLLPDGDRRIHEIEMSGGPLDNLQWMEGSLAAPGGAGLQSTMDAGWNSRIVEPVPGSVTVASASCWTLRARALPRQRLESTHRTF